MRKTGREREREEGAFVEGERQDSHFGSGPDGASLLSVRCTHEEQTMQEGVREKSYDGALRFLWATKRRRGKFERRERRKSMESSVGRRKMERRRVWGGLFFSSCIHCASAYLAKGRERRRKGASSFPLSPSSLTMNNVPFYLFLLEYTFPKQNPDSIVLLS